MTQHASRRSSWSNAPSPTCAAHLAIAVLGLTRRAANPAGPQQITAGLRWASRDFTLPRHPARPPDLMTLPGPCDPTDDLQHPDHQSQSY